MAKFEETNRMTCEEAQLLMVPMWAKMSGIDNNKKMAFNVHVIICPQCSKEYEETKKLMPLVKENWGPVSTETKNCWSRLVLIFRNKNKHHILSR